ncbi:hypothetical protein NOS3756_59700 (plasmid) [Nostoc sp. NIES-3756]|nr:hypothetical protein NOS3756_59700 [Nostoc sp. NIES-3756]
MCIVSSRNFNVVRLLVEVSADVNEIRDRGNFPLAIAADNGYSEILNYLASLTNIELRQQLEN